MSLETQTADVVVVGGGMAGLAAATYLARAGRPVILFESSPQVGGRARTAAVGGFSFNMGPHALYAQGPARRCLDELGVPYLGHNPLTSGLFAVEGGERHALPVDVKSLLTTSLFGWGEKLEAGRLLKSLPKLDAASFDSVPLADWLEGTLKRPAVRRFFEATVRLVSYVHAPGELSAGFAIRQLCMATGSGVLYLDGGWGTLAEGLEKAAREAGVRVQTRARVAAVEHEAGVTGVTLADGTQVPAAIVVVASSPEVASRLVDSGCHPALERHAQNAKAVKAVCLDLGLASLPRPDHGFALGLDRPLYFSVHSLSARLAAPEKALIHAAKYLEPGESGDREKDRAELENLMDLMQPGWRDRVEEHRFFPAMVVANSFPAAERGGLLGRPDVAVNGVDGLYLAGDWVGAEGALADASLASARRAAERALAPAGLAHSKSREVA